MVTDKLTEMDNTDLLLGAKLDSIDSLYHCGACGESMQDIWENDITEPEATHITMVGLLCVNRECPQYNKKI